MSHTTDPPPATPGDGRGGATSTLTPFQERFAREIAADPQGNATQAYRRSHPGCTYGTARAEACRLLADPSVKALVAELRRDYARSARVSAVRTLRELARIAFGDIADLYRDDPEADGLPAPLPLSEIDPAARKTIQSIRTKRKRLRASGPHGDTTQWEVEHAEYVTCDKLRALDLLCKHLGLTEGGAALEELLAKLDALDRAEGPGVW